MGARVWVGYGLAKSDSLHGAGSAWRDRMLPWSSSHAKLPLQTLSWRKPQAEKHLEVEAQTTELEREDEGSGPKSHGLFSQSHTRAGRSPRARRLRAEGRLVRRVRKKD
jgi:hypothetical protein